MNQPKMDKQNEIENIIERLTHPRHMSTATASELCMIVDPVDLRKELTEFEKRVREEGCKEGYEKGLEDGGEDVNTYV